jgi:hypothetical protein
MSKYTKVDVPGDGSCYFYAVSGFMEMERLVKGGKTYYKKGDASKLRKQVVQWIKNNIDYRMPNGLTIKDDILDDLQINDSIKDKTIQGYLNHMSKGSSYAGQIEITATANILNRNIRVLINNKGKYRNVGFGFEIDGSKKNDIFIFHNMKPGKSEGNHFEILFPKSKAQVVTKSNYEKIKSNVKYTMDKKNKVKRARKTKRGRKTMRRKTMRRKTMRRKTMRRKSRKNKRYLGGSPTGAEPETEVKPWRPPVFLDELRRNNRDLIKAMKALKEKFLKKANDDYIDLLASINAQLNQGSNPPSASYALELVRDALDKFLKK